MDHLTPNDSAILNCVFNPHLPLEVTENVEDIEETTEENLTLKNIEMMAIKKAEECNFEDAINILNNGIKIAPNKASFYNNRAQIFQFQRKFAEAMKDATKAIELALGTKLNKTLSQAYCQRGLLYRRDKNENAAKMDFQKASELGSSFAKNQVSSCKCQLKLTLMVLNIYTK